MKTKLHFSTIGRTPGASPYWPVLERNPRLMTLPAMENLPDLGLAKLIEK